MKKKSMSIAAAGLLAVTTIGLTATSSSAAFTTRCVGVGGAVTIPGDLVVPAGQSCTLNGTTVTGNVRVQADADLIMNGASVGGNVVVRQNAYLEAEGATVGGAVNATESFGNWIVGSTIGDRATSINNTQDLGFLLLEDTTVGERVRVTGGALDLVSSTVGAQVLGLQADYTDLYDTVVEGNLRIEGNEFGTAICDSEVYGVAQLRDNGVGVQLGGGTAAGAMADCDGSNYFGANVNINDNVGGVWVIDNIIRNNLTGTGNDPAPVGEDNRVRGVVRGQFAEMAPPAPALSQRSVGVSDRGEQLRELAQERGERAEQSAQRAGAAF